MALVNGCVGCDIIIITIIIHIHLGNECIVQLPLVQVKCCGGSQTQVLGYLIKYFIPDHHSVCRLQYKMCIS